MSSKDQEKSAVFHNIIVFIIMFCVVDIYFGILIDLFRGNTERGVKVFIGMFLVVVLLSNLLKG